MKPKFFTCESVSFFLVLERDFYQKEDGLSVDFKAITSTETSVSCVNCLLFQGLSFGFRVSIFKF